MHPQLLELSGPALLRFSLITILVTAFALGGWLLWLRARRAALREYLINAGFIFAFVAIALAIITFGMKHLQVNAYGAMLLVGFVLGTITMIRLGRRRGIAQDRVLDLGLIILIGAIIGARVMYVLITPGEPLWDPHTFQRGMGGLSFHGGLLGGVLAASVYIYFTKLPFWRVLDAGAPGIAIGYAITRVGCFLNGCCYGKVSEVPWATVFPNLADGLHRHPSQLYATLMALAMFGILLLLARGRGLGRAGRLFMVLLMLEGVERFTMEIFRQPAPNDTGLITAAQLLSLALIVAAAIGFFLLPKRPAVAEETATEQAEPTPATS